MSAKIRRRRTIARHGQLRSPGAFGQLWKFIGISLAVVLVSAFGVVGYVAADLASTVSASAVEIEGQESVPPNINEYEGGFDILIVGTDVCEEKYAYLFPGRCDSQADMESPRNDVNLLVHVSDTPRKITVVSFPRDLMLPIPACTDENGNTSSAMSKQMLNSAYSYGGLNCVVQTIQKLTGENIEFAASVTFGGVIEITDAIGGVDVCLASPIKDSHTLLDMAAGEYTISGYQALQFLRTRHGVGDGSDLGRIGNQQQYMSNLAKKLISGQVLGDVPTMLRLANTAISNMTMSQSLANAMTIAQIGLAVKDVPFEDIVFVQYPTYEDPDDPNRVVPDRADAKILWDAITANQQLVITHENTSNDGVVLQGDDTTTPTDTATPVDPTEQATPAEGVVELPESVRGTSAAQTTCSNGKIYG